MRLVFSTIIQRKKIETKNEKGKRRSKIKAEKRE